MIFALIVVLAVLGVAVQILGIVFANADIARRKDSA